MVAGAIIAFAGLCIIVVDVAKVPPYVVLVVVGLGLFALGVIRRMTGKDREDRP